MSTQTSEVLRQCLEGSVDWDSNRQHVSVALPGGARLYLNNNTNDTCGDFFIEVPGGGEPSYIASQPDFSEETLRKAMDVPKVSDMLITTVDGASSSTSPGKPVFNTANDVDSIFAKHYPVIVADPILSRNGESTIVPLLVPTPKEITQTEFMFWVPTSCNVCGVPDDLVDEWLKRVYAHFRLDAGSISAKYLRDQTAALRGVNSDTTKPLHLHQYLPIHAKPVCLAPNTAEPSDVTQTSKEAGDSNKYVTRGRTKFGAAGTSETTSKRYFEYTAFGYSSDHMVHCDATAVPSTSNKAREANVDKNHYPQYGVVFTYISIPTVGYLAYRNMVFRANRAVPEFANLAQAFPFYELDAGQVDFHDDIPDVFPDVESWHHDTKLATEKSIIKFQGPDPKYHKNEADASDWPRPYSSVYVSSTRDTRSISLHKALSKSMYLDGFVCFKSKVSSVIKSDSNKPTVSFTSFIPTGQKCPAFIHLRSFRPTDRNCPKTKHAGSTANFSHMSDAQKSLYATTDNATVTMYAKTGEGAAITQSVM